MVKPHLFRKPKFRDELIYDTIMEMVNANTEKTIRPEDVAITIYKDDWQSLLGRVRIFACKLAKDEYINIIRKGKVADPDNFRGMYRVKAGEKAADYVARMPEPPKKPEKDTTKRVPTKK